MQSLSGIELWSWCCEWGERPYGQPNSITEEPMNRLPLIAIVLTLASLALHRTTANPSSASCFAISM